MFGTNKIHVYLSALNDITMRNCIIFSLLLIAIFTGACNKTTLPPINYLVDTTSIVYLNNNDSLHVPMEVRFLTGNNTEPVTLYVTNLPANVHVLHDTIKGTPSFTADFVFYATNATLGSYPVKLVAYSRTTGYSEYTMTVRVVNYNCSRLYTGTYVGQNTCTSISYAYTSTVTASGGEALIINNLGGYGTITNTYVVMNCNNDSLRIYNQNIGNGITMEGTGYFTANKLVLNYKAFNTPGGFNDNCTAVLTK